VCQQNVSLEKASILFNIGALYTQIGTRCNRQTGSGLQDAITAFQKAAGEETLEPQSAVSHVTPYSLYVGNRVLVIGNRALVKSSALCRE
jgi:hypothetical protein